MNKTPSPACLAIGVALFAALSTLAPATRAVSQPAAREAPFGDRASAVAVNYTRIRPQIATAGLLKDGAAPRLKALGFDAVVDLRGPEEGAAAEQKAIEAEGLRYFNIPVTGGAPTDAQIAEFARIVADANNAPLLVHCVTANRVGAVWALYRVRSGAPVSIAFEEGRMIGLAPEREAELRRRLEQASPPGSSTPR